MENQNSPKFIPILFQTEMVQALQKGWKTMTRRLTGIKHINEKPDDWKIDSYKSVVYKSKKTYGNMLVCFEDIKRNVWRHCICPYGKPGDILWVRETFSKCDWADRSGKGIGDYVFRADCPDGKCPKCGSQTWKPAIHMPKEACRYFLKIKSIRCERLRDITEEDARSEGVYRWENPDEYFDYLRTLPAKTTENIFYHELEIRHNMKGHKLYKSYIQDICVPPETEVTSSAARSFFHLFLSINPQKHMDLNDPLNNPWVWVIEFEQVTLSEPEKEVFLQKPEKYSTFTQKNIPVIDSPARRESENTIKCDGCGKVVPIFSAMDMWIIEDGKNYCLKCQGKV